MATLSGPTLALSGGGFRSALFQIGSLIRLNEMGLLPKLACISSVSGGSITNAYLAMQWRKLSFDDCGVATNLIEQFAKPLVAFCFTSIDVSSALEGLFSFFHSPSTELAKAFEDGLFGKTTLQDLPDAKAGVVPRFVFNATSLQSGVRFWFSKEDAGDYRIGKTRSPDISLATAVAASGAFPPFFAPCPVDISDMHFEAVYSYDQPDKSISDLLNDPSDENFHDTALLADGGVYDNMALEEVWKTYDTVWVSDAGSPFVASEGVSKFWVTEMDRIIDTMMRSGLAIRREYLLERYKANPGAANALKGAYWGIATDITKYPVSAPSPLQCTPTKTDALGCISTRLSACTEEQTYQLINWAYALADAALRSYGGMHGSTPAPKWPFPAYSLSNEPKLVTA